MPISFRRCCLSLFQPLLKRHANTGPEHNLLLYESLHVNTTSRVIGGSAPPGANRCRNLQVNARRFCPTSAAWALRQQFACSPGRAELPDVRGLLRKANVRLKSGGGHAQN